MIQLSKGLKRKLPLKYFRVSNVIFKDFTTATLQAVGLIFCYLNVINSRNDGFNDLDNGYQPGFSQCFNVPTINVLIVKSWQV